ncbi:MAG: potassium channel protein [Actinobacteria bacterium]|nr:potassium channel protein [Actinomycetota bacterium]
MSRRKRDDARRARDHRRRRVRSAAERRRRVGVPAELRRLRFTFLAFFSVLLSGFIGYQVIEGVNPLDALYMTVITITTVGFREIVELSSQGKMLTIGLIVGGVGTVTYGAVTTAEFVVEGHLRQIIERRRMQREIENLHEHTIVCGFGRVGRHLALQLDREGSPFVVVDDDEEKIEELNEIGYLHIEGDATEEHVLSEAGLERARALVACVNSDADNVLVTLTSKGLKPDVIVIGRSKAEENEAKLRRAGADRVIAPSTIGGRRIAQLLTRPVVADFLEGVSGGAIDYSLEEVPVSGGSELNERTLRETAIRERFGCTILAIRHAEDGRLDTHPRPETTLHVGDVLVIMGNDSDVTAMREHFQR